MIGKSFIKDALRCKAHALRHRFSCISRKCPAIKDMVFQLQRECYQKHDLCSAAKENVHVIVEMIHFKDLLQHEIFSVFENGFLDRFQKVYRLWYENDSMDDHETCLLCLMHNV
uniref:Stanniocalcin-2 n=1 Tax=Sphaerodactylus townsendi TaxID=933632 RepID=A0ACB8EKB4_9SAUR